MLDIAKVRYLDVTPAEGARKATEAHFKATHSIWRMTLEGDALRLTSANNSFLRQLINNQSTQISGLILSQDEVLLTSPTSELQDFVRTNSDKLFTAETASAWKRRTF
jgi:hypothetical protein